MDERKSATELLAEIMVERPDLVSHFEFDCNWLWYYGERPDEATRKHLGKDGKGFRYKPDDHRCPSGRTGRWYYWDVIPPTRGKRNGKGKGTAPVNREEPEELTLEQLEAAVAATLGLVPA